MRAFLDTSVLTAAARAADLRHQASRKLWAQLEPRTGACAAHSLAELYATLTGMKAPNRFLPDQAMLILEQVMATLTCVPLNSEEIFEAIRDLAEMKLHGGIVYDALILACARKCKAEAIYTWNEKHFKMIAPDLADRIITP